MIMAKACLDKGFWMRMYGSALSAGATTMPWASGAMLAKAVCLTSCRWASQKIPSGILTSSAKSWRNFFGCLSCLILSCRFPIVRPEAARCKMAACISLGMMSWSFGVNSLAKYFSSHQGSLARVARRTACQPILSMTVVALSVAFLSSTPQSFRSCATWAVMSWDPTPPNLSWLGMTNEWFIAWGWMCCSKRHLHVMASLGMKGRIRWPGVANSTSNVALMIHARAWNPQSLLKTRWIWTVLTPMWSPSPLVAIRSQSAPSGVVVTWTRPAWSLMATGNQWCATQIMVMINPGIASAGASLQIHLCRSGSTSSACTWSHQP